MKVSRLRERPIRRHPASDKLRRRGAAESALRPGLDQLRWVSESRPGQAGSGRLRPPAIDVGIKARIPCPTMLGKFIDTLLLRRQSEHERQLQREVTTLRGQLTEAAEQADREREQWWREASWREQELREELSRKQAELEGYIGIVARLQAAVTLAIPTDPPRKATSAAEALRQIRGDEHDDRQL